MRKHALGLLIVVGLAGVMLVATSAAVATNPSPDTTATVNLTLTNNGGSWDLDTGPTQPLSKSGACGLSSPDNLVAITGDSNADPEGAFAGIFKGEVGTKDSTEGNGSPCARVNVGQSLTLSLGEDIDEAGLVAGSATLALSFKFDAIATIQRHLDDQPVGTDITFVCEGEGVGDCGPDSGESDVGYVPIPPDALFDELVITSTGAFSLVSPLPGDTHIHLEPFFEGVLACGDTIRETDGSLEATFTRIDDSNSGGNCELKPYNLVLDALEETISFMPVGDPATYSAILTKPPDPSGTVPSLPILEYDDFTFGGGFRDMLTCDAATFSTTTFDPDGPGGLPPETIPIVTAATIPVGSDPGRPHTFCIARITGETAPAEFQWSWLIFGHADPNYGWK